MLWTRWFYDDDGETSDDARDHVHVQRKVVPWTRMVERWTVRRRVC
jgi:hypothetical protein